MSKKEPRYIFVDDDIVKNFVIHFVDGSVVDGGEEYDKVRKENKHYFVDLSTVNSHDHEDHIDMDYEYPYVLLKVLKSIKALDYSTAVRTTLIPRTAIKMIELELDESEEKVLRKKKKEELESLK